MGPARSFTITVAPSNHPFQDQGQEPPHSRKSSSLGRPKKGRQSCKHSKHRPRSTSAAVPRNVGSDAEVGSDDDGGTRGRKQSKMRGSTCDHTHSASRGGTSKRGSPRRHSNDSSVHHSVNRTNNSAIKGPSGDLVNGRQSSDAGRSLRKGIGRKRLTTRNSGDEPGKQRGWGAPIAEGTCMHGHKAVADCDSVASSSTSDSQQNGDGQRCPELLAWSLEDDYYDHRTCYTLLYPSENRNITIE